MAIRIVKTNDSTKVQDIVQEQTNEGKIYYKIHESLEGVIELSFADALEDIPKIERKPPSKTEKLHEEIETLKQENLLLQAQNQANADRADFHEDLIAEMAMIVYP